MDEVMIGVKQTGGGRPIQEEEREQRLIPGINFTCHGFITKWILAAMWANNNVYPELQTWNSTDGITYTKQGATTFSLEGGSTEVTYYEYSPNPPHEFNDGDVLGIFIPMEPRYKLFFERTDSGPENYVEDMADGAGSDFTTNTNTVQTTNAVPLIAVEFCELYTYIVLPHTTVSILVTVTLMFLLQQYLSHQRPHHAHQRPLHPGPQW